MLGKKLLQLSSTVTNSLYVIRTDVEDLKLHQGDMELPRADNSALESTSTKTIAAINLVNVATVIASLLK